MIPCRPVIPLAARFSDVGPRKVVPIKPRSANASVACHAGEAFLLGLVGSGPEDRILQRLEAQLERDFLAPGAKYAEARQG